MWQRCGPASHSGRTSQKVGALFRSEIEGLRSKVELLSSRMRAHTRTRVLACAHTFSHVCSQLFFFDKCEVGGLAPQTPAQTFGLVRASLWGLFCPLAAPLLAELKLCSVAHFLFYNFAAMSQNASHSGQVQNSFLYLRSYVSRTKVLGQVQLSVPD